MLFTGIPEGGEARQPVFFVLTARPVARGGMRASARSARKPLALSWRCTRLRAAPATAGGASDNGLMALARDCGLGRDQPLAADTYPLFAVLLNFCASKRSSHSFPSLLTRLKHFLPSLPPNPPGTSTGSPCPSDAATVTLVLEWLGCRRTFDPSPRVRRKSHTSCFALYFSVVFPR